MEMSKRWSALVYLLGAAGALATAVPSSGYTGGPIRAEIAGYDSTAARVYFRLQAFDECWYPPEVYYFALDSDAPQLAVRDQSLEHTDRDHWESYPNPAWIELVTRLARMPVLEEPTISVRASADSVGVDPDYSVTRYELRAWVEAGDLAGELSVLAFCRTAVAVSNEYDIPGRKERIAVVSYVGRRYGCETVEQPVVLRSADLPN